MATAGPKPEGPINLPLPRLKKSGEVVIKRLLVLCADARQMLLV